MIRPQEGFSRRGSKGKEDPTMLLCRACLTEGVVFLLLGGVTGGWAQTASAGATSSPKHFDHVLIVVLENQAYVAAAKDKYLQELAGQGANFVDFHGVGHPSYPNYLAMIAGSTFGIHGLLGDTQINFPDDAEHKTIAD